MVYFVLSAFIASSVFLLVLSFTKAIDDGIGLPKLLAWFHKQRSIAIYILLAVVLLGIIYLVLHLSFETFRHSSIASILLGAAFGMLFSFWFRGLIRIHDQEQVEQHQVETLNRIGLLVLLLLILGGLVGDLSWFTRNFRDVNIQFAGASLAVKTKGPSADRIDYVGLPGVDTSQDSSGERAVGFMAVLPDRINQHFEVFTYFKLLSDPYLSETLKTHHEVQSWIVNSLYKPLSECADWAIQKIGDRTPIANALVPVTRILRQQEKQNEPFAEIIKARQAVFEAQANLIEAVADRRGDSPSENNDCLQTTLQEDTSGSKAKSEPITYLGLSLMQVGADRIPSPYQTIALAYLLAIGGEDRSAVNVLENWLLSKKDVCLTEGPKEESESLSGISITTDAVRMVCFGTTDHQNLAAIMQYYETYVREIRRIFGERLTTLSTRLGVLKNDISQIKEMAGMLEVSLPTTTKPCPDVDEHEKFIVRTYLHKINSFAEYAATNLTDLEDGEIYAAVIGSVDASCLWEGDKEQYWEGAFLYTRGLVTLQAAIYEYDSGDLTSTALNKRLQIAKRQFETASRRRQCSERADTTPSIDNYFLVTEKQREQEDADLCSRIQTLKRLTRIYLQDLPKRSE